MWILKRKMEGVDWVSLFHLSYDGALWRAVVSIGVRNEQNILTIPTYHISRRNLSHFVLLAIAAAVPAVATATVVIIIIIIIIIINGNCVITRWQWLFYIHTKYEAGY
jgi:hypothetical protein